MTDGKKAYYQVSFTGGQALAAVVVLIVALGVAFVLGAKAGFEKSGEPDVAAVRTAPAPAPAAAPATTSAATETSAPAVSESPSSSSEEAPVFEDREAGVTEGPKTSTPAPSSSTAPSRTELATPAPKTAAAPAPTSHPVSPSAEAPPTSAAEAPHRTAAGGFYVQVVSTSSHAEANRWKEKLAAKKYRTVAVSSVESPKGKLWRVRIGPYPDRVQANKAAAKVTAEFRQKAWVAPE